MKKLFGTDGIRARAGHFPLDQQTIRLIGYLLAEHFEKKLKRNPRFLTGRDTRQSGEWIERSFHEGALAGNAYCESVGVMTTPGVALLTKKLNFDAGIVISASHNPFQDNGIKIFSPSGRKLEEQIENNIEKEIFDGREVKISKSLQRVEKKSSEQYQRSYIEYLTEGFEQFRLSNLKVVVDCANGAASYLAPELFSRFVGEVKVINNSPNGENINKDCGSLHVEGLKAKVIEEKADLGIAFDGDADRAIFVDENADVFDGDSVLYSLSDFLQKRGRLENKTVVATVMSNIGLELALQRKGFRLLRTPVGDKYVLDELLRTGSDLGGEQSGHIIFPFRSLVGDGMQTALFVLQAILDAGKALSELAKGFERFPQVLVNVKVKEKKPFDELPKTTKILKLIEKELEGKGRVLLRYSGTENLARVMIEGEDEERISQHAKNLAESIEEEIG
ncbi:MAG: phosphoglucosamine mutase [Pyrinomonadaceae bacterium]|nr:phosphoglucosamine mutase [Pyrinomonadaceae bacterium]MCX7640529.1 phosphoglucosamine mutase [Pyrinomonadaceae bacterium]MDW8303890.1 phosphoglucosamine mutase [Acidobacteriota bacterium]